MNDASMRKMCKVKKMRFKSLFKRPYFPRDKILRQVFENANLSSLEQSSWMNLQHNLASI